MLAPGGAYAPKLVVPRRLSKSFLRQCESFGRSHPAGESALEWLSRPRPVPGRVSEVNAVVGRGLFASRAVAAGEILGEYTGRLTSDWKPLSRGGSFRPYLLRYPFECAFAIDAEEAGNELRFINHSTRANADRLYVLFEKIIRALFVAKRPIASGAQILMDYGPDYWRGRAPAELAP